MTLWCFAASGARNELPPGCHTITGHIETTQTTVGCESPVGLCFTGEISTNSPLRGTTFFTVTSVQFVDGMEQYTGVLQVTLPNGTVVPLASSGVVNTSTGTFTEVDVGTLGPFSVVLQISGTTNDTVSAFSGEISGTLCAVEPVQP